MPDYQRFNPTASAPSSPVEGAVYYDTGGHTAKLWNGTSWEDWGGGGGGTVTSVTAGDASIVIGGTSAAPTVEAGTLDEIATLHPPAAAVALNSKKITGLADGSSAQDAAAFHQIPTDADQITLQGKAIDSTAPTASNQGLLYDTVSGKWKAVAITPTLIGAMASTATLHGIAAANANDGDIAVNTHKITGLSNGATSSDAAAFGQIPLASTSNPNMDGTAAPGTAATWSKSDHVHPSDTSRLAQTATTKVTRAISTAYQESTTRAVLVMLGLDTQASGWAQLRVDSSNPPTTEFCDVFTASTRVIFPISFVVEAGQYWEFVIAAGSPVIFNNTAFIKPL